VSDPSYTFQTVVMTYPIIGNYGIADDDFETKTPTIGGLVVRVGDQVVDNSVANQLKDLRESLG